MARGLKGRFQGDRVPSRQRTLGETTTKMLQHIRCRTGLNGIGDALFGDTLPVSSPTRRRVRCPSGRQRGREGQAREPLAEASGLP